MPELNLEVLKNKKRVSGKYRPYDIPTPSKSAETLAPSLDKEPQREKPGHEEQRAPGQKTLNDNTNNKPTKKNALKPISSEAQNNETAILKKKIADLEKKLIKARGEDELIYEIEASPSSKVSFKFNGDEIQIKSFYLIIEKVSSWPDPEKNLLMYLLKKTDFGRLKDVQVGRRELELNTIHGRYLKEAKESLQRKGLISHRTGYIPNSKKKALFYSVDLSKL